MTCCLGIPRISAVDARWRSICSCTWVGELRASHRVSILLRTTSRVPVLSGSSIRCSRQMERSDLVTPVSAPRTKTTACACGIRLTVSSGSAPIALSPGVSRITSPCFNRGCAILISACRHLGISTRPCASTIGLSCGASVCQKPSPLASSCVTRRVSATFSSATDNCFGSFTSRTMLVHFSGTMRHSINDWGCRRVSIGNRRRQGGTSASKPISVGHIVVRPALAGMMRRPYPAKKMALINSDFPRENSATKATMTLSARTRTSSRRKRSSTAASSSS